MYISCNKICMPQLSKHKLHDKTLALSVWEMYLGILNFIVLLKNMSCQLPD